MLKRSNIEINQCEQSTFPTLRNCCFSCLPKTFEDWVVSQGPGDAHRCVDEKCTAYILKVTEIHKAEWKASRATIGARMPAVLLLSDTNGTRVMRGQMRSVQKPISIEARDFKLWSSDCGVELHDIAAWGPH